MISLRCGALQQDPSKMSSKGCGVQILDLYSVQDTPEGPAFFCGVCSYTREDFLRKTSLKKKKGLSK